jgi:hypothetical protein
MALKGGSSVGVRKGGESDGFTTNAEEQADARALKEQMEARTASSPVPAGMWVWAIRSAEGAQDASADASGEHTHWFLLKIVQAL